MKCVEWKDGILLADSGELDDAALQALEEHLSGCDDCRDFSDNTARTMAAARRALCGEQPASATVARILERAGTWKRKGFPDIIVFPIPVVRIAACAAVLAVVAGGWFLLSPADDEPRVGELRALVAMVSEEVEEDYEYADGRDNGELQALARELLIMEGLSVEDSLYEESSQEEPAPTALQSHSSDVLPVKRCV